MNIQVIRLEKGADLKVEIGKLRIESGCIVSAVGCLSHLRIRLAEGKEYFEKEINVELVSLSGTISSDGLHLHILTIDKEFNCYGGHLLEGCVVDTTMEIVVMSFDSIKFKRLYDKNTGYNELVIKDKNKKLIKL